MKGKKKLMARSLASVMSASMVLSLFPVSALAAPETVYTDGVYTGTATVEPDVFQDFTAYEISVDVTVAGGKVTQVALSDSNTYGGGEKARNNKNYSSQALSGVSGQIVANNGTDNVDTVSRATCSSNAIITAAAGVLQNAKVEEQVPTTPEPTPVINTAALEQAMADAKAKTQTDYTEESWSKLADALAEAEELLKSPPIQADVDKATEAINTAIAGLVEVPEEGDDDENDDNNEEIEYVLMNIPYAKFYAAEVSNSVGVDAVSSATLSKTRTGSLVGGSYHKDNSGTSIDGIIFPVKVGEGVDLSQYKRVTDSDSVEITVTNRGQTSTNVYSGKEALFENASYSYYVLSEAPSYYKELTVGADGSLSFGAVQGAVTSSSASAEFTTDTTYGDYELDILSGLNTSAFSTIYGVVIGTTDGTSYGLRHLENIWRTTFLAWSTGYTTTVHGCTLSYAHYASMPGKTINTVTYYTDGGIFKLNLATPVKVPNKFSGYTLEVADAVVTSGQTDVTLTGLPNDFDPEYSVKGLENVAVNDGVLTYNAENAANGEYTLTVSDKNETYADITATFELRAESVPAEYDEDEEKLVKTDAATDAEFENFISKITTVSVDGKAYAASGRGSTVIINKDGTINTDAKSNNENIFDDGQKYNIVVKATGYPELSFAYEMKVVYLLMNIPYADFYAAEVSGSDAAVDAVSSATLNKTRTSGLVGGSYHVDPNGSDITGVTFPVRVKANADLSAYKEITDDDQVTITVTNRGQTSTDTYTGSGALFENASYAYYKLSDEEASQVTYYKDLTVADGKLSFGAVKGAVTSIQGAVADFTTDTTYGDYELDIISGLESNAYDTIYGVVLGTTDGSRYGLRHLENIWRDTFLAWSAGYTTTVHGCTLGYEHYVSMMGKTINTVTYYTNTGIYELSLAEPAYVPVKFEGELSVEDALVSDGQTTVTLPTGIPEDYDAQYSVDGLDITVTDGVLTFPTDAKFGNYTLTVKDANGKYADLTADFVLVTGEMPAEYNGNNAAPALVPAADTTADEFAAYLKAISSVSVNGKSYAASGRGATVIVNAEDGTIDTDAKPIAEDGIYNIVVSATGYQDLSFNYVIGSYILMNIPYADFYAAEVSGNDAAVDAVSSATLNKTRTSSLVGGSYHVDPNGTDITGVTFPVKVSADADLSAFKQVTAEDQVTITVTNRGQTSETVYTGSDALFENASYAYYALSPEEAAQLTSYKELTVAEDGSVSFGAIQGAVTQIEDAVADFTTDTTYGDYELDIIGGLDSDAYDTIYGVVLGTTDGSRYGLRHLENIWRDTFLAWSAGYTTTVHGCTLGYEHYVSMMGKTIDTVTYYTNTGIYELSLSEPAYVPVKFEGELSVADAMVSAGQTTVTLPTGMPKDYDAEYSVDGLDASVADGVLTFPTDAAFGTYTLTVTDKKGVYADLSADFILITEAMPAEYNGNMDAPALVPAADTTADEFTAYISAISAVSVNGTKYAASGRGATVLINADGTLAVDAKPIAENGIYEIVVSAAGYQDLAFTYKAFDLDLLNQTIKQAKALNENNYTAESWADVKAKLAAAEAELADPETQDTVDEAAISLLQAIAGLVVADKETAEIDTSALAAAVAAAKTLKESDYTEASWKAFAEALTSAEAVLAAPESQTAVDHAKTVLADAVGALVKKPSENTDDKKDPATSVTPTETPNSSTGTGTSTGTTNKGTGTSTGTTSKGTGTVSSTSSTKTGDVTNIVGWLAAAAAALGAGGVSLKVRGRKKK